MSKIEIEKTEKFIERVSLKYFIHLSSKFESEKIVKLEDIPSDKILHVVTKNVTFFTVFFAFIVGALTTVPAVVFEMYYKDTFSPFYYYLLLSVVTLIFLVIEMAVLYWLGMRSIYTLATLTGYDDEKELPLEYDIKKMMIRSILDIEEPVFKYLGIDSQKYVSKKWFFIRMLLYKAKKSLTRIVVKFLIQKVATRYSLRVGLTWIAIPISAIWDAISIHKTIKNAKLKLFGSRLSKYIAEEILSEKLLKNHSSSVKEGCIRAISSMMILSKNHHPNNIILLLRINKNMNITEEKNYDDLDEFLIYLKNTSKKERHLLKTLTGISAVLDGNLNKTKREVLKKIFGEDEEKYMSFLEELKKILFEGRLHQASSLCDWMFSEME
jgi:hypothetical protein